MKTHAIGAALLIISLAGPAAAQQAAAASSDPAEVSCADILASPSASAEDIAALNDTSVVTVLRCQEADANANGADLTALRSAVAANATLAPRITAAGAAPDQVVAVRRGPNGDFNFYVIGGYR